MSVRLQQALIVGVHGLLRSRSGMRRVGGNRTWKTPSVLTQICEFTGLPRHTAIELLLVHGGDPAAVLAQMFP